MNWYKPSERAQYLYDGVHAEDLDDMIILSAERDGDALGERVCHFVCLEGSTIALLLRFLEKSRGLKITVERATPGSSEDQS